MNAAVHHAADGFPLPAIPGFELGSEVARGGMGVIYQARDLAINRTVAIKLLQDRFPTDSPAAQRFLEEAQITGQLQHPGIPPIYQVGKLADGRPYLAMKLIKGETLDAIIKKDEPGSVSPGSPRVNYLALIEAIAQAVGYAHAHGVLHRDLKPQNIMVGSFGEVQVMDWGLAKLLTTPTSRERERSVDSAPQTTTMYDPRAGSDGSATQAGSVLGTPAFMAPEQAAGEIDKIDPRTDVFGLGAVFCCLLTGHAPYRGSDAHAILAKATRGHTDDAFARLDACGAEPDVIALCKRCLAFDPKDRPADGNAVANEVAALRREAEERARQAEIEEAKARVFAEEQRKRRKVWFALTAVLLVGVIASSALALWAMRLERQAAANEAKALAERDEKDKQRQRAEANEKLAEDRLVQVEAEKKKVEEEKQIATAVRDFLQYRLLAQLDPTQQADRLLALGRREEERDPDPKLSVLVARAAAELAPDKIEANFPKQPLLQAALLETVGNTYRAIGGKDNDQYALAISFLERSAKLREHHLGVDHPSTLSTLANLALAYDAAGRLPEAIRLFEQVRAAFEQKLGADHPSTLTTLDNLAGAYRAAGRLPEAIRLYEQVRDARMAKLGADHPSTLTTLNNLALAYQAAGRLPEAIRLYEQVRAAFEQKLGADHPSTLTTLNNLALAYQAAGRLPEAIRLFEQVRDARVAKLGADHPDTLTTLNNLARAYDDAGRLPEAIRLFEQVRDAQVPKLGADHPDTLTTLHNLALAYEDAGRLQEAIRLFEQVRESQEQKLGADHPYTLATLNNLAGAYRDAGRLAEAIRLLEQVRAAIEQKLGADHPDTLTTLANLAGAYQAAGRLPEAIRLFEQVRAAFEQKLGADHPSTLTTLNNLARAYDDAGRLPEAIQLYEQVRDARVAKLGADHPDTLTTLHNLARAYYAAGRLPEALPLYEQAAQGIAKRRFQHEHAQGIIAITIGAFEEAQQFDKAEAWRRQWLPVVKQRAGAESPDYANELAALGLNLLTQQKWPDAETTLREALAIRQKTQPDAWTTFNTMSMLGGALLGSARSASDGSEKAEMLAEAEPLLLKGYEDIKARLISEGQNAELFKAQKLRLTETCDRLIDLYTVLEKPDEVKKWQAEKEKWK